MSEVSMRVSSTSKQAAVRGALIKKAYKFLEEVKSEELKVVSKIKDNVNLAERSFTDLVKSKQSADFKQLFGNCLITLQDTLNSLQELSIHLSSDLDTSVGEDDISGLQDSETRSHVSDTATSKVPEPEPLTVERVQTKQAPKKSLEETQQVPAPASHVPTTTLVPVATTDSTTTSISTTATPFPSSSAACTTVTATKAPIQPVKPTSAETGPIAVEVAPTVVTAKVHPQSKTSSSAHADVKLFHQSLKRLYKNLTVNLDETIEVTCGFHQGPNYIWLQTSPPEVDRIAELICLGISSAKFPTLTDLPAVGSLLLAKYDLDQFYYRAVVKKICKSADAGKVKVFFIDFGNVEAVTASSLLQISGELETIPPQAVLCSTYGVAPPVSSGVYTDNAMDWFEQLVNEPLKGKMTTCSSNCPILLVHLQSLGKDVSTEMKQKGHAVTMSTDEFVMKYGNMTNGMKEFYTSLQPLYKKKKVDVAEPSQPPFRPPTLHNAMSPPPQPRRNFSPYPKKPQNGVPAEFARSAEMERRKQPSKSQIQTMRTIQRNQKKLMDDFVADMGIRPLEGSTGATSSTRTAIGENTAGSTTGDATMHPGTSASTEQANIRVHSDKEVNPSVCQTSNASTQANIPLSQISTLDHPSAQSGVSNNQTNEPTTQVYAHKMQSSQVDSHKAHAPPTCKAEISPVSSNTAIPSTENVESTKAQVPVKEDKSGLDINTLKLLKSAVIKLSSSPTPPKPPTSDIETGSTGTSSSRLEGKQAAQRMIRHALGVKGTKADDDVNQPLTANNQVAKQAVSSVSSSLNPDIPEFVPHRLSDPACGVVEAGSWVRAVSTVCAKAETVPNINKKHDTGIDDSEEDWGEAADAALADLESQPYATTKTTSHQVESQPYATTKSTSHQVESQPYATTKSTSHQIESIVEQHSPSSLLHPTPNIKKWVGESCTDFNVETSHTCQTPRPPGHTFVIAANETASRDVKANLKMPATPAPFIDNSTVSNTAALRSATANLPSGTSVMSVTSAPLADTSIISTTAPPADTSIVSTTFAPLAATNIVSVSTAPLADTNIVSASTALLVDTSIVSVTTAPLADTSTVSVTTAPPADTSIVSVTTAPPADTSIVSDTTAQHAKIESVDDTRVKLADNCSISSLAGASERSEDDVFVSDESPKDSPTTNNNISVVEESPESEEHISPESDGEIRVPSQTLDIEDTKKPFRVLISHINTPSEFYVNLCNEKTAIHFNQLDGIPEYYDRLYNSMLRTMLGDYKPKMGDYCVAKSDQFSSYYRAEVVSFRESKDVVIEGMIVRKKNSKTVKVFFIDYGSSEWVCVDHVFPLMPQFGGVPPLAWQCTLTDIYPLEGSRPEFPGGWNNQAVDTFNTIVPESSVCDMFITNPRSQMVNEILQVILEVPADNKGTDTVFVNERLVELKAAHSLYLHGEPAAMLDNATVSSQPSAVDMEKLESESQGEDDLTSWKPMAEDFYSHSNMYGLNPEDAEVVLTGYKSQEQTKLRCKEFARRGQCSRGDLCHFEHIIEREGAVTEDTKEVMCTDTTVPLPVEGTFVVAELTATITPAHFYVKFPFGSKSVEEIINEQVSDTASSKGSVNPEKDAEEEDFSDFQLRLNTHYSTAQFIRKDAIAYAPGEIIVAKFTEDDTFYRARVVESDFDNHQVKVFFVDFGNSEWTSHANIREMLPRFLHLPFQAVECFLPIEPIHPKKEWTDEETEYFNQLADGKLLICQPIDCNRGGNCMTVQLLDANSGTDVWLSQQMVDAKLAKKSSARVKPMSAASSLKDVKITPYLPG